MSNPLDKLDFELRRIYTSYLESLQREKDSDAERPVAGGTAARGEVRSESSPGYNLALRYQNDLSEIENLGFKTTWNEFRGFAHGVVHLDDLERIVSHPNVLSLEYGSKPHLDLDHSVRDIKACSDTEANIGINGLWFMDFLGDLKVSSKATGKGVIVGIIDSGIDVSHPVFMKSLSPYETRILRIWDQGLDPDTSKNEKGPNISFLTRSHTFGVEFNYKKINEYLNSIVSPPFRHKDCRGHGTHVAAIAAGNGNPGKSYPDFGIIEGAFEYIGVAPEADIIVVKYSDVKDTIKDTSGTEVSYVVRFREAVRYILKVANFEKKSAVINCSFSYKRGPHDGLTEDEQILDKLFDSSSAYHKGNILVKSAGNYGGKRQHAKITIPASREIVVPFKLYDLRPEKKTSYIECKEQDNTTDVNVEMWYQEVSPPHHVTVAVKAPTESKFSPDVNKGYEHTKKFDRNKERTISHVGKKAVDRPNSSGGNIKVYRNQIRLEVMPNRRVSPPQHKTGIYEIKIKGPPDTVVHAWCYPTGRGLGCRVGPSSILKGKGDSGTRVLKVFDTTGFNINDRIRVCLNNGTQHETTISSIAPGTPGVLNVADSLPSAAGEGKSVFKVLVADIEVDDKYLIDSFGGAKNIITVAAYDDKNGDTAHTDYARIAGLSSRGPLVDYSNLGTPYADKPDIAAPGVAIKAAKSLDKKALFGITELFGRRFINMFGTSMAAAHITGVIALLLEKKKDLSVDDVKRYLSNNARAGTNPTPTSQPNYKDTYGSGMVDATKSYDAMP